MLLHWVLEAITFTVPLFYFLSTIRPNELFQILLGTKTIFLDLDTLIKWKTLYNKSCRYYFIESITVEFCIFPIFLRFYINFTSSLFNAPWALGPKYNFYFTFRSCRQLDGRQVPIFENFPIRHIFLKFWFF